MLFVPFSPVSVGGCKLWLKADSLSLNDGDAIDTWADSSGSGNTASQSTAGKKPTYKTAIRNGKPVARFDGSASPNADGMTFSGVSLGTSHTMFVALKYDDFAASRPIFGAATTPGVMGYFEVTGTKLQYGASGGGIGVEVTNTMSGGTWYVFEIHRSGTSVQFYASGTQIGTTQTLAANNAQTIGVLGWTYGNDDSSKFDGDIAEALIYDSALSTPNRQRVRRYLGAKYGITIA